MPSTSLPNNGASIGRGTSDSRSAAPVATDSSVSEAAWTRASQVAVVGLFVIALVWCAYVAQHIIVPLLLAWTIATVYMKWVKATIEPLANAAWQLLFGFAFIAAGRTDRP